MEISQQGQSTGKWSWFHLLLQSSGMESSKCRTIVDIKSPLGGPSNLISTCEYKIQLDWVAGEDEDQVALKLQSQLMVTLPAPHYEVAVRFEPIPSIGGADDHSHENGDSEEEIVSDPQSIVNVSFSVHKTRDHLKMVSLSRTAGSGPSVDGSGVLNRMNERLAKHEFYRRASGALPIELAKLPMLQRLYLDNNKITVLPPELDQLEQLKRAQGRSQSTHNCSRPRQVQGSG